MFMYVLVTDLPLAATQKQATSDMDDFILKIITGSLVFRNCLDNAKKSGPEERGRKVSLKFFSAAESPQLCCCREHTVIIFTSAGAKLLDNSSQDR